MINTNKSQQVPAELRVRLRERRMSATATVERVQQWTGVSRVRQLRQLLVLVN
jgi:hypothetical protein